MTKNIKIFLLAIIASMSFFWGINTLQTTAENYIASAITSEKPFLLAQINQTTNNQMEQQPIGCPLELKPEEFTAQAILLTEYNKTSGQTKILLAKAEQSPLPIASLTKLMTAIVAEEFNLTSQQIEVSQKAVDQEAEAGKLKAGEILTGEDLLKIALIESSNDAAFAIAELLSEENFVALMNLKAKEMGLVSTRFFNSTGLDTPSPEQSDISSCEDLTKISQYLLAKEPKILEITALQKYDLILSDGSLHHSLQNTNELLGEIPDIIGGKTGLTNLAGGCLLEILKTEQPNSYLIAVVLGSSDRFNEMRQLINYGRNQCH